MAESKTQARRSGPAKGAKASAKGDKAAAKPPKDAARAAAPAKGAKAPAKGAKAPAKATKSSARAGKTPRAAKVSAKPKKAGAEAASEAAKAAVGPQTPPAAKPSTPRPPAKRKVVQATARGYFDAVAARDAAAVAAHWHREGIYDSVPVGVFRGPDAVRRLYQETFTAMPDMQLSVERITADDRIAAVQWRATGTFSGGPFRGIEPTGRLVELRGIDCLEVEDGKVLRNTSVYDGAAVARGMGLLPQEDSGADRALRAGLNTVTKLRRAVASRGGGDQ